jgi:ATP-grasp domain
MTNILLTGGRAPVTLDLARAFQRAGHTVFMAESLRGHLSQPSNAVKAHFVVPAPRLEPEAFLEVLTKIIEENQVEVLIPTCEEVFHIAKGLNDLPCWVFTQPLATLDGYHNKWKFVTSTGECDLRVPESMLMTREDDLLFAFAHWRRLVLKPIYSRFATRTLICPSMREAFAALGADEKRTWVAQAFITGQHFCSYSVCHNGRITAHAVYPAIFTAGQGATVAFEAVEHPAIFEWVQTYIRHFKVTGQMAFDFVQTPEGELYALECNPRATSGLHLLASHPRFVEAFLNPEMECIVPEAGTSRMLGTAMLVYGLPAAIKNGNLAAWVRTFFRSDDVLLDFKDPMPALLQLRSLFKYMTLGRRQKISALEASTFDIEWNGE